MKYTIRNISIFGILIALILGFYSCYLRFTTQKEYFTWLWNASPEVQYVTGWALFIFIVSFLSLSATTEKV